MEQEIWENMQIEDLPGEDWRDVVGYEGKYLVSNLGRVKSLNYNHTGKEQFLKQTDNGKGYLRVFLRKNGKSYQPIVNHLVAISFIPNPENKPEVHHRDGNTHNNIVSNLLWVSRKEHRDKDRSKKVLCIETGTVYPSSHEASRKTGAHQTNIIKCCRGKRKTTKGYHWQYAE